MGFLSTVTQLFNLFIRNKISSAVECKMQRMYQQLHGLDEGTEIINNISHINRRNRLLQELLGPDNAQN